MSKQKIEDCYFEHNSTIFSEMLGEDEEYLRLKKAKRAAEEALQSVISKEAWNQYLALDAKAFKIALVPSADRSMDTCTVCQMRRGYDYVVMHR